jgi:hypothetical protein
MEKRFIIKIHRNKRDKSQIAECFVKDRQSEQDSYPLSRSKIINDIEQAKSSFYTLNDQGETMPVTVQTVKRIKYLKATRNDTEEDNLGKLPEY